LSKNTYQSPVLTGRAGRIVLPLAVFGCVLLIGALFIWQTDKIYKASCRIWVQDRYVDPTGREPGQLPQSPLESSTNLPTFCEVLESDAVLNYAYQILKKELPADKLPPRGMLNGLDAKVAKDANIITVEFKYWDKTVAAKVVECVIKGLMVENSRQIAEPLEETRGRLQKQLELAQDAFAKVEQDKKEFEQKNLSVNFDSESDALDGLRSSTQQKYDEAQDELKALRIKIDYLQKQLGFGPEDVIAVEKITNDDVVKNLKQTIAETEVKLIELRSKFQDEHPRVKRLRAVLDDARKEMENRYSALIGKVDPKFDGLSPDDAAQHGLLEDMIQARTEVVLGESKIESLKESLDKLSEQISAIPDKQAAYADLTRKDELATTTLAAIESELERIRLTEAVSTSSSRMQVIDSGESVDDLREIYWLITFGAASLLAAATAVLQHLIDPRILNAGHVKTGGYGLFWFMPKTANPQDHCREPADRLRLTIKGWLPSSKIIWVTGVDRGDGSSLLAYALAESFSDSGADVVLVDANVQNPRLHINYGEKAAPGLVQYLQGEDTLQNALRSVKPNLHFLPVGSVSSNLRVLAHASLSELLNELARDADVVIVDSPASGLQKSGLIIPDVNPNVLLTVRIGHSMKRSLQSVLAQMPLLPVSEVAIILNCVALKSADKLLSQSTSSVAYQPVQSMAAASPENDTTAVATW
jgi:Mrp family chromosome partitioning ATPase/uncharacterized protein involved in exopolysaccharide biosynthesis